MADASFLQTNFLGGEFSPYMQGRADHKEYRSGLNRLRNAIAVEEGAATRRPGTRVCGLTRGGAAAALREFHFSQAHSYLMEFTDGYLRFWSGLAVATDAPTLNVISLDSGAMTETSVPHAWSTGDYVVFGLSGAMPSAESFAGVAILFGRQFTIEVSDATHFQIKDPLTGNYIDGSTLALGTIPLVVSRVHEVMTAYTNGIWATNRVVQDESVALILNGAVQPYQVTRTSDETATDFATFSYAASTFYDGPYLDPPTDGSYLTPSALTGAITLTATGATPFASTDVGRMVRLLSEPLDWASGTGYSAGDHVKYDGGYYTALASSTGAVPGTSFDKWAIDPSAALWSWGRITAVADSTHATLALAAADPQGIKAGGDLLYTHAIKTWRLGVYSDTTGWPTCGTFMEGRLWLAGATGNRVDSSMSLDTFWWSPTLKDGTVADNCGISAVLKSDSINRALWMVPDEQGMMMGTQAGEWLIRASNNNDPITPTSIQAKRISKFGSENIEPCTTPLAKIFVQRDGRNLIEYVRNRMMGSFQGINMSLKAKHFTESGIQEVAFQALTTPIIWLRNGDGELVGCTYRRDEMYAIDPVSFAGWHKHSLGTGRVIKSIQTGPSTNGDLDALSMVTFDPAKKAHFVEVLTDIFEQNDTIYDAWFLDGSVTPAGVERVTVDGIDYLRLYGLGMFAGDRQDVWVAGVDVGTFTISAEGIIDVPIDAAGSLLTSDLVQRVIDGSGYKYSSSFFHEKSKQAYVMTAEDNYTAAMAADWDDGTLSTAIYSVEQSSCGTAYDPTRRLLLYTMVHREDADGLTTNTTGHTLWDGRASILNGGAWNQNFNARLFVMTKDIDTGEVTSYDTFDPAETVPAGIGGGDGTWRRFVREAQYSGGNWPNVTDPRTGDFWIHAESCELYCFRAEDNYTQTLSPFFGVAAISNFVFPVVLTDDWMFAREEEALGVRTLHCIPRLRTADETTADELLAYASYTYPANSGDAWVNVTCSDHSGGFYLLTSSYTGPLSYTLYHFDPPTSAPHGGPVVGGGFTDVTPWAAGTGPNMDAQGYIGPGWIPAQSGKPSFLYFLPDRSVLVAITKQDDQYVDPFPGSDPNNTFFSCTNVDINAGTFDHHARFVTGYMTAEWEPTTDPLAAAYQLSDVREINSYLGCHSYAFDEDYTKRWIAFEVFAMSNGVSGDTRTVFVQYQFAFGSAPAVVQFIDEARWREFYPDYSQTYHQYDSVVSGDPTYPDDGVWDEGTKTFWFSGGQDQSLFFLNDAFTVRGGLGNTLSQNPPFLKMTFGPAVLPVCLGLTYTTQCQILRAVEPQQAGAQNGPALGKTRRTHQYAALVASTQGISFGTDFSKVRPALFESPGGTPYAANQLFSGVWWSQLEDDYSFDSMVCWTVTRPYPATVLSLSGFLHCQDR